MNAPPRELKFLVNAPSRELEFCGSITLPRMSRLDRVSNPKAADVIIVVGLVLFAAAILNGLLMSFTDGFTFTSNGVSEPTFKDRVMTFLQSSLSSIAWATQVTAAGVALRIFAQRTPPVAPTPGAPTPGAPKTPVPFDDVPGHLPITIDVVEAPADDDGWRR